MSHSFILRKLLINLLQSTLSYTPDDSLCNGKSILVEGVIVNYDLPSSINNRLRDVDSAIVFNGKND